MKKPKTQSTTPKTWLKMDLEMQSGSIWTDEKSKLQKKKSIDYELPEEPNFIDVEIGTYDGKPIISRINILRD